MLHNEILRKVKATTRSRFIGVFPEGTRFRASISHGGKHHYLGAFDSEEDAAMALDKAALRLRCARTRLNFDPETGEELIGRRERARKPRSGSRRWRREVSDRDRSMIEGWVSHRLGGELPPSRAESSACLLGLGPVGAGATTLRPLRGRGGARARVSSSFRATPRQRRCERQASGRRGARPRGYGHGVGGLVRQK
jgi:hypothetical protein